MEYGPVWGDRPREITMGFRSRRTNRNFRIGVGLMLAVAFLVQCQSAPDTMDVGLRNGQSISIQIAGDIEQSDADGVIAMARKNPLDFLLHCRDQYDEEINDYECKFLKQELIDGKLTAEQITQCRFREEPFSVYMNWLRNPGKAQRTLYIQGAIPDDNGRERAWVRSTLPLVCYTIIKWPINDAMAKAESRRTIDEFGFRNSLELIIKYCELARENKELDLRYIGTGNIEGRDTLVFERHLPYTGESKKSKYPDRLLVVHIDKEYLLPIGCFSYADENGEELLGKYVMYDISLNPGYSDEDFDVDKVGL